MSIKSVHNVLDVFEALVAVETDISLSDLARQLNRNTSTLHHILQTLRSRGYLHQDAASRRYSLGYKALALGQAANRQNSLVESTRAAMRRLVELCGETVTLGVMDNDAVLYVAQEDGTGALRMSARPGSRWLLHATASGKVLLAFASAADQERLVQEPLKAYTPNTITATDVLRSQLEDVRRLGYALDLEERELGMVCVSAPIFGSAGAVEACMTISGPTNRMSGDRLAEITQLLLQTTEELSNLLGPGRQR